MTCQQCRLSGQTFSVSEFELQLRARFGFSDLPCITPQLRFRQLGAFWPHWNLHSRRCDKTGNSIISIFRPDCEFPVWDRSEWIKAADPPQGEYDFQRKFFEQAWELFSRCPLPHTFQSHNQNCEYTDDFYHSKNCYLCHSSNHLEDCRYSLYGSYSKDVQFSVFFYHCELCSDIVNSHRCYRLIYGAYCREVRDSAFMYDCRNCSDCMFCSNLRGKQYCFENQQLSKQDFLRKKALWNLNSRASFEQAKSRFDLLLRTQAWHRALHLDQCENVSGNYLSNSKDCEDCYISPYHEECVHDAISGPHARSTLDSMGSIGSELLYYTVMCVYSYQARFSFELNECRFCDYCMYCFQCKNCFACCGLVGKQFCIFNRQYSEAQYQKLRQEIISHMQSTAEWGEFFPGYFAPNPYDESCSGFFFALSLDDQQRLGFRAAAPWERKQAQALAPESIPDSIAAGSLEAQKPAALLQQIFWDEQAVRPFRIYREDLDFCQRLALPLPNCFYVRRVQDNFKFLPFNGTLRDSQCGISGVKIKTNWPCEFDGRILCEDEYLRAVL